MQAPSKANYPILAPADLAQFDAFILGIPTRYGSIPAQFKVNAIFKPFISHSPVYKDILGRDRSTLDDWRACG